MVRRPVLPAQLHIPLYMASRNNKKLEYEQPSTRRPVASTNRNRETNKDEDETARGDLLRDLPEWLEEFTENLVDERVPAHKDAPASSSRESASEPLMTETATSA